MVRRFIAVTVMPVASPLRVLAQPNFAASPRENRPSEMRNFSLARCASVICGPIEMIMVPLVRSEMSSALIWYITCICTILGSMG